MIPRDMTVMKKDTSSQKGRNKTAVVDEEFNVLMIQVLKISTNNFIQNTHIQISYNYEHTLIQNY